MYDLAIVGNSRQGECMITIKSLGFMDNLTWIITENHFFFFSKTLE